MKGLYILYMAKVAGVSSCYVYNYKISVAWLRPIRVSMT